MCAIAPSPFPDPRTACRGALPLVGAVTPLGDADSPLSDRMLTGTLFLRSRSSSLFPWRRHPTPSGVDASCRRHPTPSSWRTPPIGGPPLSAFPRARAQSPPSFSPIGLRRRCAHPGFERFAGGAEEPSCSALPWGREPPLGTCALHRTGCPIIPLVFKFSNMCN
ncbi:formin-like protein 5 [Iris pallida]|uniref:Formin-like protein 5 n=1 Tax=Iris pallida TaxID=29817 RepID=A0AAX6GDN4_IRIPA|nr:formin-like protein 5 [Iris pallida]